MYWLDSVYNFGEKMDVLAVMLSHSGFCWLDHSRNFNSAKYDNGEFIFRAYNVRLNKLQDRSSSEIYAAYEMYNISYVTPSRYVYVVNEAARLCGEELGLNASIFAALTFDDSLVYNIIDENLILGTRQIYPIACNKFEFDRTLLKYKMLSV